jgi:hypothetical protein
LTWPERQFTKTVAHPLATLATSPHRGEVNRVWGID